MRILFISNYYPPYEVGGYEQLCRDVAESMAARGHQVAVLTSDLVLPDRGSSDDDGVYRELKRTPEFGRFPGPAAEFFLTRRRKIAWNLGCLDRVIAEFKPEVAFIWNLQGLPRELAVACENRDYLVTAYWLAGYTPAEPDEFRLYWQREPSNPVARWIKGPLRKLAQRMWTNESQNSRPSMAHAAVVSRYMLDKGISNGTLPKDARVIYNGVEYESFYHPVAQEGLSELKMMFAGRLSNDKGAHTVVEAMGQLAQEGKLGQTTFAIAGSGPAEYAHWLRRLITEHGLEGRVRLLGFYPRDKMPELLGRHHVLVLPSIYPEAFSRVVLEGMAAGLAVVGSTAGGTSEILENGVNGLAFAPGDSKGLSRQLRLLIEDDALRHRLAVSGQRRVEKSFTMANMVDRLEQFLCQLLEEGDAQVAATLASGIKGG